MRPDDPGWGKPPEGTDIPEPDDWSKTPDLDVNDIEPDDLEPLDEDDLPEVER